MSTVWSGEELAILDRHLEDSEPAWLPKVCKALPRRSVASIRTKMAKRRVELGVEDRRSSRWGPYGRGAAMLAAYRKKRSYRKVAEQFGVHPYAVKWHVHRARAGIGRWK